MRDYELTLVISPELASEDQKKLLAKIQKIIEELKGKPGKLVEWGKKELAYPIKKQTSGYYFFLETQLPEKAPVHLNQKFKLEEAVMRYLLVKGENKHGAKVAK